MIYFTYEQVRGDTDRNAWWTSVLWMKEALPEGGYIYVSPVHSFMQWKAIVTKLEDLSLKIMIKILSPV